MAKKVRTNKIAASGKNLTTIIVLTVILAAGFLLTSQLKQTFESRTNAKNYHPKIIPSDFTTNITNPFFTLIPGMKLIYLAETPDGTEKVEIQVTRKTKKIMGVTTLVYWDRVWLDGELVEDTRDYLAQNKNTGDVWYFGEEVDNYENGALVDHKGSWIADKDIIDPPTGKKAQPGIWIKANPQKNDRYLQEYYEGVAEDTVKIRSINEKVTVPYGTFKNCVKTYDFTPLDPQAQENKYYCPRVGPNIGALVLEKDVDSKVGSEENLKLVEIDFGSRNDADDD